MASALPYKDYNEFLAKHSAKNTTNNNTNQAISHTRIPDANLNIYGGSYIIPREELSTFYSLYYEYVFDKKRKEYLTEKQLECDGPLVVDFDFRYNYDVIERQHSKEHVIDMISIYLEELKEYFIFEEISSNPSCRSAKLRVIEKK
jgi:hypothetical protein